ncbi:unnamed protein product [Symbiodinium sp. KB8]|nr:unnamed protein product [Symbiodinium sp. KB8]
MGSGAATAREPEEESEGLASSAAGLLEGAYFEGLTPEFIEAIERLRGLLLEDGWKRGNRRKGVNVHFKYSGEAGLNHVLSMCRVPDTAASMFQDFNSGKAQERYNEVCKEEQILQAVDHEMPLGQERYVAGIYQMPNPMKDRLFFWREWAALVPCEDGGELYISIAMTPSAEVSAASVIMGDVKGSMPKAVQNMVAGNASSYLINFRDAHSH